MTSRPVASVLSGGFLKKARKRSVKRDRLWPASRRLYSINSDLSRFLHPLVIKGLILNWEGSYIPNGYRVQWAGADRHFHDAAVPSLKEIKLEGNQTSLLIPAVFGKSGVKVRYVKLILPELKHSAVLAEMRFIYDWGPWGDAESNL